MNYHGRIVERNEGRMGLWRNVSWSVLSESVILDMVTAFTRLHKSSSHGIPIIWKVPPLLPNRPRSYLPPVPIPRMAANRSILTMRWKPVIISLRSVGFSTMLMSRWTGIWSVTCMPFSSRAPDRSPTRFSTWAATRLGRTLLAILSLRQGLRCRRMFPNLWTGCLICARNLRMNRIRSPVSIGRLRRFTHFRTAYHVQGAFAYRCVACPWP